MIRVLYDPDGFFSDYRNGWIKPISVLLVVSVVELMVGYVKLPTIMEKVTSRFQLTPEQIEVLKNFMIAQMVVGAFVGVFVGWLIMTGVLHGLSALFGGRGDFSTTLKYTAYAYLPSVVTSPLSLTVHPPQTLILGLAGTIWQGYILVFALKYARSLETGKSVVCVAIPLSIVYALSVVGYLYSLQFSKL